MYKRILVPVDGSKASRRAVEEAANLAIDQQAQIRLVHVVENPYTYVTDELDIASIEQAWRRAGQQVLDQAVATVRALGVEPESALLDETEKSISQAIVDDARDWNASLIVMGSHGRHGLERFFLGSVAEGVARMAPVPVLLVHES
jgi:nucleotide-binding universal stress UspA family protein